MQMTTPILLLCFIIAILIAGFAAYLFWAKGKFIELENSATAIAPAVSSSPLVLTAYERLAILTERLRLENLVHRLYESDYSARQMQQVFTATIRQEYDHNITQQLYVPPALWEAITKMKEQNIFIINQIAALLPIDAKALDLNKQILEMVQTHPEATMNHLVLEAIQFEAKKLL